MVMRGTSARGGLRTASTLRSVVSFTLHISSKEGQPLVQERGDHLSTGGWITDICMLYVLQY
jgi:hypothetical protein